MSRFYSVCLLLIGFNSIRIIEAARILAVLPMPSISHQVVFRALMHELVKRGHEVVIITPDPAFPNGGAPANLTEIDLHDLSYKIWREQFVIRKIGTIPDQYSKFRNSIESMTFIFDKQLESDEVLRLLRDKTKTFDLLFIEACFRPALLFSHFYKAPVILISSFGPILENEETIGAPVHPFLYPSMLRQRLHNLTMWEKVKELHTHYSITGYFSNSEEEENRMLRKHFGADFPSINELKNNVDMLFLNVNPLWLGNHPMPPSVVYMGGIHQNPEKELPQDLKSFLDSSKNGVVYISFGSNVQPSTFPPERIRILVSVLSQLPYDVLWKWDTDEMPGLGKNIRISKWFPQSDLLRHPKIKLFISQAGLQSTDEAITAGVPLIGIPIFADQWYNAEKYEQHGIGIKLLIDTITEENFMGAIKTVINDGSYRRNIVKLRELMRDQPQTPLERAVWWTEHVLRHGSGRHLRCPAANISWAEYLELQFVAVVLLVSLTFCVVSVKIICLLINYMNSKFIGKVKKH